MAARIRLARTGTTNKAYYRIVVIDGAKKRNGWPLETLGTYNPTEKYDKTLCKVDKERLNYWLAKGAIPGETVGKLIKSL